MLEQLRFHLKVFHPFNAVDGIYTDAEVRTAFQSSLSERHVASSFNADKNTGVLLKFTLVCRPVAASFERFTASWIRPLLTQANSDCFRDKAMAVHSRAVALVIQGLSSDLCLLYAPSHVAFACLLHACQEEDVAESFLRCP